MHKHLLSIEDLSDESVARVFNLAERFEGGESVPEASSCSPLVVGLVFLEASLRTRVGFSVAAARLGGNAVEVSERRAGTVSMPESIKDTLRTTSGMVDVVVARIGQPLDRSWVNSEAVAPVINGGDGGPEAEHPSQALVDCYAMERELGPISGLRIAVCGDLRMRAVRSLLQLMARKLPRRLTLVSLPGLDEVSIPSALAPITDYRTLQELEDVDVLYAAGMPHESLPEERRKLLIIDHEAMTTLPTSAIVLSPLPVLDEIDPGVRSDSRIRMFTQSDRGVFVRMALLTVLAGTGSQIGGTEDV